MLRLLTLFFLLTPAISSGDDLYHVVFSDGLEKVNVEACFDGTAPGELYRSDNAGRFTRWVRHGDQKLTGAAGNGRLTLPDLPLNSCIAWEVDLADAAKESDRRSTLRLGDTLLTDGDLWFWLSNERRPTRIEVKLPPGYSISTPWKELPGTAGTLVFQPENTPASWSFRIAIGRFPIQLVPVAGTTLRVAVVGVTNPQQSEELAQWVGESAQSVAAVFGYFPRPHPQILVVAVGPREDPVLFAHVMRGGGIAAEFFVDTDRPADELSSDWTATHELSHMLLPYVDSRDRWLSEGLASYYQNVLRARDGRLSEAQAWRNLDSGFERGKAATNGGSLASATRSGWTAVMRVYWSGAAILLEADARLRALTDGRQTLDTALAALHRCCFNPGRRWRANELFSQLDRLTGFTVFAGAYEKHVMSDEFPDTAYIYRQLGLVPAGDSMQLDPDAPWGRIRHYIMSGTPAPARTPAPAAPSL